ncbi:glycosyltransferase [Dysgonomonas sp. 511]|uniref:glycosyltransferase n=1 Tax=Dysgonomonas sp. 511 TaxID=2302930 RepID=UPI0013D0D95B|nr:glycosyltransferase [Dysgonomonas sp. 511]NDV78853.1 glycosyltransferase [Dysgonomonas sp. 511]
MRILQVITSLNFGGAEKLIVDMVPLYIEKGYQVDVLLFDGTETSFKKQLQDKGVNIHHLEIGQSVYNPLFIFKIISFLKHYDIIHTHNTACQYFVALAKYISFSKVKLVTTEHSPNNRRRSTPCFYLLDKFIYERYDTIISISPKTLDFLSEYIGYSEKFHMISNGINISTFYDAETLDKKELVSDPKAIIITMVAGFRHEKDQDTVIRAFSYLPLQYKLCLVGEGPRRKVCETLARELELTDRVIFTGIRSDIPQILKASDIIVMSSHYEGLSLSSIEGMSVGKPFIASDVDGLHEITEGAGILFPKGDEKALARIIQELMNNKSYYQQIAEKCMQRASEYDIQKTVNAYEDVYKRIMS